MPSRQPIGYAQRLVPACACCCNLKGFKVNESCFRLAPRAAHPSTTAKRRDLWKNGSVPKKKGTCGLCRKTTDLHDSHLLPTSLYKLMKEPRLMNPNPVIVQPGVAIPSSVEVRQFFLCADCEHLLNKSGENWIVRNCAQPDSTFPLYTKLKKHSSQGTLGQIELYTMKGIPAILPERIEYFALSVFWRAGATTWRNHHVQIQLGRYEELLRQYLVGDAGCRHTSLCASSSARLRSQSLWHSSR